MYKKNVVYMLHVYTGKIPLPLDKSISVDSVNASVSLPPKLLP